MIPPEKRVSRCLPRDAVSSTVRPVRSAVANRGTRRSLRATTRPLSPASSLRAARQTLSPSGTATPQTRGPKDRTGTAVGASGPRSTRSRWPSAGPGAAMPWVAVVTTRPPGTTATLVGCRAGSSTVSSG